MGNKKRPLLERLQAAADDPMWADHAEVPKSWLHEAIEALTAPAPEDAELVKLRDWCQSKADACMEGKRPTIARRHYAQAYLTVAEKIDIALEATKD